MIRGVSVWFFCQSLCLSGACVLKKRLNGSTQRRGKMLPIITYMNTPVLTHSLDGATFDVAIANHFSHLFCLCCLFKLQNNAFSFYLYFCGTCSYISLYSGNFGFVLNWLQFYILFNFSPNFLYKMYYYIKNQQSCRKITTQVLARSRFHEAIFTRQRGNQVLLLRAKQQKKSIAHARASSWIRLKLSSACGSNELQRTVRNNDTDNRHDGSELEGSTYGKHRDPRSMWI